MHRTLLPWAIITCCHGCLPQIQRRQPWRPWVDLLRVRHLMPSPHTKPCLSASYCLHELLHFFANSCSCSLAVDPLVALLVCVGLSPIFFLLFLTCSALPPTLGQLVFPPFLALESVPLFLLSQHAPHDSARVPRTPPKNPSSTHISHRQAVSHECAY